MNPLLIEVVKGGTIGIGCFALLYLIIYLGSR